MGVYFANSGSVCYAIMLPGWKSAFRDGFRPGRYRESTEIGPPARKRTPTGPPRHPLCTEGTAKTGTTQKSKRHLTQNAEDKKRTTNKHPKSNRYLRGLCAHALRGGFGETPRHAENTNTCISLQFWSPGSATTQEHLVFYEGF